MRVRELLRKLEGIDPETEIVEPCAESTGGYVVVRSVTLGVYVPSLDFFDNGVFRPPGVVEKREGFNDLKARVALLLE